MADKINRSIRLPQNEYFPEHHPKTQIYLHHTVSSRANVWDWWTKDRGAEKVATAYVVGVDGEVYELFDPSCWAWHLGLKSADNTRANQQSIGIEIVSEGVITKNPDGSFAWAFGTYQRKPLEITGGWRGFKYFDPYDDAQVDSVCQLVKVLCEKFKIPRVLISGDRNRYEAGLVKSHSGILSHCNVREDKTDVHPGFPWARLESSLKGQI